MLDWYQENLVDTGRSAALWLLISFLVTYTATRAITVRIHKQQTNASAHGVVVKDIVVGGVHIHHQVWGILIVLTVGLFEFRFQPESPWVDVLAALFGVGAALALDEFALWLHLEDVYWTEEGKQSIDAVMISVVFCIALLVGTSPIGVNIESADGAGVLTVFLAVALHATYTIICLLKGKLATGLIGLPIPMFGFVGAVRLGKPTSFWARRFYSPVKMEESERRFGEHYQERRERVRNKLSGMS